MFGQILKEARKQKKLTQIDLANIIGVKPAEISQYESSKRLPRLNVFIKIIDTLDISADEALGREIAVYNEENYQIRISKKDLEIINLLKEQPKLYNYLSQNPQRAINELKLFLKKHW